MSEVKERPILFNAKSVRAILEGRKTQTRRIIKPQPGAILKHIENSDLWTYTARKTMWGKSFFTNAGVRYKWKCPLGKIGDRLWVRETWQYVFGSEGDVLLYKADLEHEKWNKETKGKWKPSIFMPRWASRITLEIVDVGIERLQDITPKDSVAEGIAVCEEFGRCWEVNNKKRSRFGVYWDTVNTKRGYSWDKNPWVWVITFRKVKGGE